MEKRTVIRFPRLATAVLLLLAPLAAGQEREPGFQEQAALFSAECGKCHTIGKGDRVGPDLAGVTGRRDREWLVGFIQDPDPYLDGDPLGIELLQAYQGVRMEDRGLSRAQVEGLLAYIDTFSKAPAAVREPPADAPAKSDRYAQVDLPDEGRGLEVHWVSIVGLLSLAGLAVWWWKGLSHALVLFVLASGAGYWTFGGRPHHHLTGNQQGYEPAQPIAYSHELHAGQLEIGCLYCHSGADKGPIAGVPSVATCMNCHRLVKNRPGEPGTSPEIQKLFDAWESRNGPDARPIEWVRVHRLPDFVSFSHKTHVQNGLHCQECHGPVETMPVMRQASDLSMGWCVDCHRHEGRKAPSHWKRSEATLDCSACHQ